MSHFTVAVITKNNPTNEELNKVLQPYHEYECTGFKDQYVVPVDETDDNRSASSSIALIDALRFSICNLRSFI